MKKLIKIAVLLLFPLIATAQIDTLPWCPPGATWVYDYGIYLYKATYVGDTVLLGRSAKKLSFSRSIISEQIDSFNFQYETYMAEGNDTLFMYRDERDVYNVALGTTIHRDERWDIHCAFNAEVGNSWLHKEETNICAAIDTIKITNIDTIRLSNAIFLTEEYILNATYYHLKSFYKGLGTKYWYPYIAVYRDPSPDTLLYCEGNREFSHFSGALDCYTDSVRGTIIIGSLSRYAEGCNILSDIDEVYYNNVTLFPNPTSTVLNVINLPSNEYHVQIYDNAGKKVYDKEWDYKPVNINNFNSGIYFLHIQAKSGEEKYFKFIKE